MSSDWVNVRIGDVGSVVTGTTPSSKLDGNWGDGAAFLTPSDMPDVGYVVVPARRLSRQRTSDLAKRVLPPGSVAVSCIASIGKVARITQETVTNQQVNALIPNSGRVDDLFTFYWLQTLVPTLHKVASGSVAKIINKTDFSNLTLDLPPLAEQRRIAGVLGALDDLIEVNSRLMFDLRALCLAVVVAVAGGTAYPRLRRLDDVADHRPGKYLRKSEYASGGAFTVYGSNSVMGHHTKSLYSGPLTVLARIGSNCGNITFSMRDCWVNNNASAILAKDSRDAAWIHHALSLIDMSLYRVGSGQPYIDTQSLMESEISWPASKQYSTLTDAVMKWESAASELETEIVEARKARDELLPLLMSGRVRVGDVAA